MQPANASLRWPRYADVARLALPRPALGRANVRRDRCLAVCSLTEEDAKQRRGSASQLQPGRKKQYADAVSSAGGRKFGKPVTLGAPEQDAAAMAAEPSDASTAKRLPLFGLWDGLSDEQKIIYSAAMAFVICNMVRARNRASRCGQRAEQRLGIRCIQLCTAPRCVLPSPARLPPPLCLYIMNAYWPPRRRQQLPPARCSCLAVPPYPPPSHCEPPTPTRPPCLPPPAISPSLLSPFTPPGQGQHVHCHRADGP